ncbi:uncharacterized protein LOC124271539 [Haliotis rubra]|uniref:uncharacterized protein LOC124271539 n=1 Tax=Haliotis rubra TaxID=36100 RepID=UPI001EE579A1|nr:uncharacterized protein LOC124271539 [Haliotis rubra]
MIDHILLPETTLSDVLCARILDDAPFNVSDHNPVICTLSLPSPLPTLTREGRGIVSWEKARSQDMLKDYTFAVSHLLWSIKPPTEDCELTDIDEYYSAITCTILHASRETLPMKSFRSFLKPYWNKVVNDYHNHMTAKRRVWLADGKPRGPAHTSYREYKAAKSDFRKHMKQASDNHISQTFQELEQSHDLDIRTFWNCVRSIRGGHKSTLSPILYQGAVHSDPEAIFDAWANHFQDVYAAKDRDNFNSSFCEQIESLVEEIRVKCKEERDPQPMKFTELEVAECCAKLKNNKAGGADKIVYEHLKYGGRTLMFHLATLYNIILESGHIPTAWRESILVPLYKGGNKSKKDPNSYRGISLSPVLSKVFEMVLLSRLDGLNQSDTFPPPTTNGIPISVICPSHILQLARDDTPLPRAEGGYPCCVPGYIKGL